VSARVDRWLLITVALALAFYLATLPRIFERLSPMTGDEPFYLMTAVSLIRDHDLDESNNYAQRDYDEFYRSPPLPPGWRGWTRLAPTLAPHEAVTDLEGQFTKHGIGLPLLVMVPFEAFGRSGAVAVIVACAVALAGQMYLLARHAGAAARLAAAIALGLAVSMPVTPYMALLFPEVPAALLLLYAVRRIAGPANTGWQWFGAGCAAGFLPWLHQRWAPTAALLALLVAARWWRQRFPTEALAAIVPVVAGGLALIAFNLWLYGAPIQPAENHDGFNDAAGTVNGAFGLLLDAQWGLWVVAPLMIVSLAASPWWWRADRATAAVAALALAPYLLVLAAYSLWWGSWGPPARYLVPVVPFAAGTTGAWLARASLLPRVATLALWCVGMLLTLIGLADPQRFYHQPDGENHLVRRLSDALGIDLAGSLVAFQTLGPSPLRERVVASLAGLALLVAAVALVWVVPARRARIAGGAAAVSSAPAGARVRQ
jgi:hypothetical protein